MLAWILPSAVALVALDLYVSFFWLNRPASWCVVSPTKTLRNVNETPLAANKTRDRPTAFLTSGFHVSPMYLQPRVLIVTVGIAVFAFGRGATLACIALSVFITYDLATATKSNAWLWMTVVLTVPTSGVALVITCVATPTARLLAVHATATIIMVALLACIVSSGARGRSLTSMNITLKTGQNNDEADVESGRRRQARSRARQPVGPAVFGIPFLRRRRLGVHVVYLITHTLVWTAMAVDPDVPLLVMMALLYIQSVVVEGAGLRVELDVVDFVMMNPYVCEIMKIRSGIGSAFTHSTALYGDDYGDDDTVSIPPTIANFKPSTVGLPRGRASMDVSGIMTIPLPSEAGPTKFLQALLQTLRVNTDL